MPGSKESSLISGAVKFIILTAFIGAIILAGGRLIFFRETPVREYITITTIISMILALGILSVISSRKKRRRTSA